MVVSDELALGTTTVLTTLGGFTVTNGMATGRRHRRRLPSGSDNDHGGRRRRLHRWCGHIRRGLGWYRIRCSRYRRELVGVPMQRRLAVPASRRSISSEQSERGRRRSAPRFFPQYPISDAVGCFGQWNWSRTAPQSNLHRQPRPGAPATTGRWESLIRHDKPKPTGARAAPPDGQYRSTSCCTSSDGRPRESGEIRSVRPAGGRGTSGGVACRVRPAAKPVFLPCRPPSLGSRVGARNQVRWIPRPGARLAIPPRSRPQILAIVPQQIEGLIDQPRVGVADGVKAGPALSIQRHSFAVENGGTRRQLRNGRGDRRKALRPVVALPGVDRRLAGLDVRLDAIAIELDLMRPRRARGRAADLGRVQVRQEVGLGGSLRPGRSTGHPTRRPPLQRAIGVLRRSTRCRRRRSPRTCDI